MDNNNVLTLVGIEGKKRKLNQLSCRCEFLGSGVRTFLGKVKNK